MRLILLHVVVLSLIKSVQAGFGHPGDPFCEYMWTETLQEREEALNSTLMTGILSTKLDPTSFGVYMNQHAVFIYNTKRIIGLALQRTEDVAARMLLMKMIKDYEELSGKMLKTTSIKYPSDINLGKASSNYLNHLYNTTTNYEVDYFIAAMLPRYKLWPWLGEKLQSKQNDFGVFSEWVETNLDPSYTAYVDLENIIDEGSKLGKIDHIKALFVYKQSMEYERDIFSLVL